MIIAPVGARERAKTAFWRIEFRGLGRADAPFHATCIETQSE
jgi:hypothetical protein